MNWAGIDFAGYILARIDTLPTGPRDTLDASHVSRWIRETELFWHPGLVDHRDAPWHAADGAATLSLIADALSLAKAEAQDLADPDFVLAAQRRLPWSTISQQAVPASTTEATSDGHVHQGAALPLDVMINWVASGFLGRTITRESQPIPIQSIDGYDLDARWLLLGLAIITHDAEHWREAYQSLFAATVDSSEAKQATLCRISAAHSLVNGHLETWTDMCAWKAAKRQYFSAERYHAMLHIEAILYGSLVLGAPGLDRFVRTFETMSGLRRGKFDKAGYYVESLRSITTRSAGLKRVELRLGELVYSGKNVRLSALAQDYHDALTGYLAFAGAQDVPLLLSFPFSLVKTRWGDQSSTNWGRGPGRAYELLETLADLIDLVPGLSYFVDGVDICGKEEDAPSWALFGAIEEFLRRGRDWPAPPTVRVHAGEWTWSPLNGLRRIAEAIGLDRLTPSRVRIGHALAFGRGSWERAEEVPLCELLDDLLWAWDRLALVNCPGSLRREVERYVFDVCDRLQLDVPHGKLSKLVACASERMSRESLLAIGFLGVNVAGHTTFVDGDPIAVPNTSAETLVRLIAVGEAEETLGAWARSDHGQSRGVRLVAVVELQRQLHDLLRGEVRKDLQWSTCVVEVCPTSNVVVGGIRGFSAHPVSGLLDAGVPVTINSDDPSLFHVGVGSEFDSLTAAGVLPSADAVRASELGASLVCAGLRVESVLSEASQVVAALGPLARREG